MAQSKGAKAAANDIKKETFPAIVTSQSSNITTG
jgi:hypothetical protein